MPSGAGAPAKLHWAVSGTIGQRTTRVCVLYCSVYVTVLVAPRFSNEPTRRPPSPCLAIGHHGEIELGTS